MNSPTSSHTTELVPLLSYYSHLPAGRRLQAWHPHIVRLRDYLQSFVLLFLRLTIAWQLAESGFGHLSDLPGTAKHFREWGVPLPELNVYISGTTELIGGILLMLGLGARFISLPLLFNFIVAYATASRGNVIQLLAGPKRLEAYDAVINDAAFTMVVLSLSMLAFGAGKVSLDYLIVYMARKWAPKHRRPTHAGSVTGM